MAQNQDNREIAIQLSGVKKMYKLGQIGGGTLQADLQSWWARKRGKEDPNTKIGQEQRLVGQTFMALNGVDLTVYKGEALGIIGSNGAGKSTLLKLLSQVTAPTEGVIDIYGRVASMLEVGTGFNGEMTGRENIYMNGAILGMSKAEIDAKMGDIIEFSEVRDFIDTPVKRYSSGMYVKLAFSVAAHLDSEIMIMDEVLAVGDIAFQKKCLNKMRDAANRAGRTVLYVSHNMNTIRQLCDRCVVLDKGKVLFEGEVNEAIEIYLGTVGTLKCQYEYTDEYHPFYNKDSGIRIDSLELLNVDNPRYESGQYVELMIKCTADKAYKNIGFRFEIGYKDGEIVGTALTDSKIVVAPGKQMIYMGFPTDHLVSGRYRIGLVVYVSNELGTQQLLDGVYPGFTIEIVDEVDKKNQLQWLHQYWGHVHFHDVIVKGMYRSENSLG